jgi:hypothetical protein
MLTTRLRAAAAAAVSIAPVVLLALIDEGRQAMSDARTGTTDDVWLDIAGGCGFLLLAWWTRRRFGWPRLARPDETAASDDA